MWKGWKTSGTTAGQEGNRRFGQFQKMQGPGGNENLRLNGLTDEDSVLMKVVTSKSIEEILGEHYLNLWSVYNIHIC